MTELAAAVIRDNNRGMPTAAASIAQRVNRERVVVLGWSRAILLQVAHPLIAAGVIEHSAFRGNALEAAVRLHHTVSAMLSLIFGAADQRAAALARIRAIHKTVNGTLKRDAGPFPAHTPYTAEDPALLLWVHATLIDSSADIYQRVVATLTAGELDALCVEAAPVLHELGGDPRTTPMTWRALQDYLRQVYASGALAVSDDARTLGRAVLSPRAAGVVVPFSGVQELLTVGLLPADVRSAYGFDWSEERERRFHRAVRGVRSVRRLLPDVLAHWKVARKVEGKFAQLDV